jgi:hypothetical protein
VCFWNLVSWLRMYDLKTHRCILFAMSAILQLFLENKIDRENQRKTESTYLFSIVSRPCTFWNHTKLMFLKLYIMVNNLQFEFSKLEFICLVNHACAFHVFCLFQYLWLSRNSEFSELFLGHMFSFLVCLFVGIIEWGIMS